MGDCDVDIFLARLKQLITSSRLPFIIREKHQLEYLERKIKYLREFLETSDINTHNKYAGLTKLVMQIRDVISEAEGIVDHFVSDSYTDGNASLDIESVKMEIENLSAEVKRIYDNNLYDINGVVALHNKLERTFVRSEGSNTSKLVKDKEVVGFEEEVNGVLEKLNDQGKGLEIITILGPGGGGKSTLAREVYHHSFTRSIFEICAWVDVSQNYNNTMKRDLLTYILKLASPNNHSYYKERSEDQLGEEVHKCLKNRKYLIVLDDIWCLEIWNDMQRSFPKDRKGSKILFTSRLLVQPDNINCIIHCLGPLTKTKSWELLQKKIFGIECCPLELVGIGPHIAEKCEGLPLGIVTIAGILARKERTPDVWEEVAKHLSSLIAKNEDGCMKILELSYNYLPPYLKSCFMYVGAFPEDCEIIMRELIWLWIAEGFIQPNDGGKSLEAIANDYLIDLVERNLIMIARKKSSGEIKACRIHDLLRELCLRKAEEENFFVKINEYGSFSPSAADKYRRLIIGSRFFDEGSLRPRSQNLRSILCLRSGNCSCSEEQIASFLVEKNFKLLKVLSFVCTACPRRIGIEGLVHLRYLAFGLIDDGRVYKDALNLEIINIHGRGFNYPLPLPPDVFKMVKLRHIYRKEGVFAYHVSCGGRAKIGSDHSFQLDCLQTLHRICGCDDCQSFLVRTPNLRKLGIAVPAVTRYRAEMICDLEFLKCLETLKFTTYSYGTGDGVWSLSCNFPRGLKLPPTVTRITLDHVDIIWEELTSVLQTLPNLEVLKITNSVRCGPIWDTSEEEFSQIKLKYLKLANVGIVEWIASAEQFPGLEVLVIEDCLKLEQIPIDFADLYELRKINIKGCSLSLAVSASNIQEEQRKNKGDDDCLDLHAIDIISYGISKQSCPPRTVSLSLNLPPSITTITLDHGDIIWKELTLVLQTLPNLEVLKITDSVHCGPVWDTSEEEFSELKLKLKYLKLANVGIEEWNASAEQFPSLEVLVMKYCRQLEQIPIDFANLRELRKINIKGCSLSLAVSALNIQEEQRQIKGDDDCLDLHAIDIISYGISTDPRFVASRHGYLEVKRHER